jgi:uncharacterized protein
MNRIGQIGKWRNWLFGVFCLWLGLDSGHAATPSFDCSAAQGTVEQLICKDDGLAALDVQLAAVYAKALKRAVDEQPSLLNAEQRGWIKGRNECWKKGDDARQCVEESYRLRIAELQARYRLVAYIGPVFYQCGESPVNEVVATYFETDPPSLIAERGDQVSFMVRQRSASGTRYKGRNESLWEHQGEATVTWGYGNAPMQCRPRDAAKSP